MSLNCMGIPACMAQ